MTYFYSCSSINREISGLIYLINSSWDSGGIDDEGCVCFRVQDDTIDSSPPDPPPGRSGAAGRWRFAVFEAPEWDCAAGAVAWNGWVTALPSFFRLKGWKRFNVLVEIIDKTVNLQTISTQNYLFYSTNVLVYITCPAKFNVSVCCCH